MDANLNRAREGLRVVEELVRLGLGDRALTARCRQMRHVLAGYPEKMPGGYRALLIHRDAGRDVGAPLWPEEAGRAGLTEMLTANLKRTQEALRVLEECAKVLGAPVAELKDLRFAAYILERDIVPAAAVRFAPAGPRRGRRRVKRSGSAKRLRAKRLG